MKNVYLTGFLGATKASVGRILSGSMGGRFLDFDHLIEAGAGLKVSEIFQIFGEDRFRELEAKAITSLEGMTDLIVISGGGIISHPGNLPLMKKSGYIVHLDVSFDEIAHRVLNSSTRYIPSMEKKMRTLFEQRRAAYLALADVVVSANEGRYAIEIVTEIEGALRELVNRLPMPEPAEELIEKAAQVADVFQREVELKADVDTAEQETAKAEATVQKVAVQEKKTLSSAEATTPDLEKKPVQREKKETVFSKLGKSLTKTPEEKREEEHRERMKRLEQLERRKQEDEEENEEKMRHAKPWKPKRVDGQGNPAPERENGENEKAQPEKVFAESMSAEEPAKSSDAAEARRASAEAAMKRLGMEPKAPTERPAFKPRGF